LHDRPNKPESGAASGLPPPEPWHSLGLVRALRNSAAGFAFAYRSERAFREEVIALAAALPVVFWISDDPLRRALLIASVIAVIVAELLNSGLEKLCDLVHPAPHPSIKAAKDMGSAAVLSAIAASALLWGVTLWQRLM
jgi:diacylglycerol kinase (ATP)